jgi:NADPH:quinone reductase-like Zn-dependent oxidoreductase
LAARVIDLDPAIENYDATALFGELATSRNTRIALRGGERWVPRLQNYRHQVNAPLDSQNDVPLQAMVARPGTFDGVELRSKPQKRLLPDEVKVHVLAAGLNFRDVLLALGMYPGANLPLGAECAGTINEIGTAVSEFKVGDRVFGFAPESLASEVTAPAAFIAPLPDAIDAKDAAGVPVAFLTAHYGLNRLAKLRRGQRVLIHAAAGGVGLAAVQLAQRQGAEIFATAGSPEKRELLHSLGVAHVMDSRSLAFADQVLNLTAGKGVDVVLNSLAGEFISESMRALADGGCFLELGKRDIWTPETVKELRPDIRYYAYDLGAEVQSDRGLLRPMLDEILASFSDGSLRPLPVTEFPFAELREAMRFMAQARHVGKIVLRVANDRGPV